MSRRSFIATCMAATWVAGLACASAPVSTSPQASVIYIVRHAEKQIIEGERDPELTEAGQRRAEALAAALSERERAEIDQIISSQFRRTQATVAPLAAQLGLEVEIVDARQGEALATRLRGLKGQQVVVAGHSNTVPELIAGLGVADPVTIDDGQYGDLFVVSLSEAGASLQVRHFGAE